MNFLHSSGAKKKLKPNKKVCENKDFCGVAFTSENTRYLVSSILKI